MSRQACLFCCVSRVANSECRATYRVPHGLPNDRKQRLFSSRLRCFHVGTLRFRMPRASILSCRVTVTRRLSTPSRKQNQRGTPPTNGDGSSSFVGSDGLSFRCSPAHFWDSPFLFRSACGELFELLRRFGIKQSRPPLVRINGAAATMLFTSVRLLIIRPNFFFLIRVSFPVPAPFYYSLDRFGSRATSLFFFNSSFFPEKAAAVALATAAALSSYQSLSRCLLGAI